ncbi:hypothetical protein [Erythrobacter sp. THAF29]|uniref:hypothetical protein n=1 Tax=Erythrobacter sp. THAF29 TaxID=2587851 RepID=UPI0012695408|nr:hypothetical protein [Erythrobacter sp. THAF29]QFT77060.1 hypothetical protein FIU90_05855 [Erythrobacter sp. THAF29]
MSSVLSKLTAIAAALALLAGCNEGSSAAEGAAKGATVKRKLGLNSSLPLYWPLGVDIPELLSDEAPVPWQRRVLEQEYDLVLLGTLSPIEEGLTGAETDPLRDIDRLAVIQPRGLAPADNVALDNWVREGGKLLLVLDPLLTGEYEVPLGSPQRPVDSALIPPIVARWGLEVSVEDHDSFENGFYEVPVGRSRLVVGHPGAIAVADPNAADCGILARGVMARCKVGEGQVVLLADAAAFETAEFAGPDGEELLALMRFAFD